MTDILFQEDLDAILNAVSTGENDEPFGDDTLLGHPHLFTGNEAIEVDNHFNSIESLQSFLINRDLPLENLFGIFQKDVSIIRFGNSKNDEKILQDIYVLNQKNSNGNIKIPESDIELINFSYCNKCNKQYSFQDLISYYSSPKKNIQFANFSEQLRNDTTVVCSECEHVFIPAIIISDGNPKNQVQFLCRMQTIEALEKFHLNEFQKNVLTKSKKNLFSIENKKFVKNDIHINDLQSSPSLIVNILQYSPPKLGLNFINGLNIENGDYLFGSVNYYP